MDFDSIRSRRRRVMNSRKMWAALHAAHAGAGPRPAAGRPGPDVGRQPDRPRPGQGRRGPARRHRHRDPEGHRPQPHHGHRERRHLPAALAPHRPLHRHGRAQRLRHGDHRGGPAERRHPARDRHRHEPLDDRGVDHRGRRGAAGADDPLRSARWSARSSSRTCRSTAGSSPTWRSWPRARRWPTTPTRPSRASSPWRSTAASAATSTT